MEAERDPQRDPAPRRHAALTKQAETPPAIHPVMALQQQAGNQAVQGLLRNGLIQPKLTTSNPADPEELEADRVADHVMRAHSGVPISAPCTCAESDESCEACNQKSPVLQRRASAGSAGNDRTNGSSGVASLLRRESGQPLDAGSRAFFEPRFGHDFSDVRVHTGPAAAESARSVNALAYTLGNHIVFSDGHHDPQSGAGRRLLAHELSHTIQQGSTASSGVDPAKPVARSTEAQEAEARHAASSVLSDATPRVTTGASAAIACESGNAPGGLHDDEQLGDAIRAFNANNSSLGPDVLSKIRSGILNATGKTKTYEVAYDFFNQFSGTTNAVRKMTSSEESKAKAIDRLAETDTTLGFTSIALRSDVLEFDSLRLGNLLLHEFTHAFHSTASMVGDLDAYQEGQSYGTEYFYAESTGDKERVSKIKTIMNTGAVCGVNVAQCQMDFRVVYALLTALSEIVKNGSSSHLPFSELDSTTAQKVEVDVMRTFQDPGADLKKYKDYVQAHLTEFKNPLDTAANGTN